MHGPRQLRRPRQRRLHAPPQSAVDAWDLLYTSNVYNCKDGHENHNYDWVIARPRLFNDSCPTGHQCWTDGYDWRAGVDTQKAGAVSWYEAGGLVSAWTKMLAAGDALSDQEVILIVCWPDSDVASLSVA